MEEECGKSLSFQILSVCHAKLAAEYGNFVTRSLDGLTARQSAETSTISE